MVERRERFIVGLLFGISIAEGVFALWSLFQVPSAVVQGGFLGFSYTCWVLALVCLAVMVALFIMASFIRRGRLKIPNSIRHERLVITFLCCAVFYAFYILILFFAKINIKPPFVPIMERSWGIVLWLGLLAFQCILLIRIADIRHIMTVLTIIAVSFAIFRGAQLLLRLYDTREQVYWHLLAEAFNHGRLYLENPPNTHDLTLFAGRWYVPNPPLPALVLMPVVALFTNGINMMVVSALIGAINVGIVYCILRLASEKRMTETSLSANLWITAVFALSTSHFWMTVEGLFWFFSQQLTVTFLGLSCLAVMRRRSLWLIGFLYGLAILSRPNIFPFALLLAGIYLSDESEFPKIPWKRFLSWSVKAALPAVGCVFLLLFYNYIRFGDWLDFGYVTINGDSAIVAAIQEYGMFNLHFLRTNAEIMFLRMPKLEFTNHGFQFNLEYDGVSIFLMTPTLFYAFRRFRLNWWTLGAYSSTLGIMILLLLYHNTGWVQIGYRYLIDMILPLLLLMALGVGKRVNSLFKVLVFWGFTLFCFYMIWLRLYS